MKRAILGAILVIGIVLGIIGWRTYLRYTRINVHVNLENPFLLIPSGATFKTVMDSLTSGGFLIDEESFREMALLKGLDDATIRPGRYKIEPSFSNRHLVNLLLGGPQATVRLVLNGARLPEDVAVRAGRYLEADSSQILQVLTNEEVLKEEGIVPQELMCTFIPNTYDFFWNTSPRGFLSRMRGERDKFWARDNRLEKAAQLELTPCEIMTLASIVEKETIVAAERPRVAGLYLNRLRKGMRLQADPTAVFATRDFTARRILNRHISFDSPYNTYLYPGLPPGPICMPSINSIDAVLNAEHHEFLFMCAKPDNSGEHAFAKTHSAHSRNASKYRVWLNSQGIR